MKKQPVLSKKAAIQLLFQGGEVHPQMGNLSAMSLIKSLDPSFFDEERCRDFLLRSVHKDTAVCPHCKELLPSKQHRKFWAGQQCWCSCGKKFHATTKTPLFNTPFSAAQIACMAVLFVIGLTDGQVSDIMNSNHHTMKRWRQLLGQ